MGRKELLIGYQQKVKLVNALNIQNSSKLSLKTRSQNNKTKSNQHDKNGQVENVTKPREKFKKGRKKNLLGNSDITRNPSIMSNVPSGRRVHHREEEDKAISDYVVPNQKFSKVSSAQLGTVHEKKFNNRCNQCEFSTFYRHTLKRHIRSVHEKIKDNECHVCESSFSTTDKLKWHVLVVHDKVKRKSCDRCSYKAFDSKSLELHIRAVHEKIKDKVCHMCQASFAFPGNLIRHVLVVHEEVKRKSCDKFSYKANDVWQIKRHKRLKHGMNK